MPLHLHLERVDPTHPERAAAAACRPLFARLPAGRRVLLAMVGLHDDATSPGLCVAPWTRTGLERVAHDAGFETDIAFLSARQASRIAGARSGRAYDPGPRVSLDIAGAASARSVPRNWAGTHLCLVVPGLSIAGPRGPDGTTGPVRLALGALDQLCQRQSRKPDPGAGARIASTLFASTTVVVDASWWSPLLPTDSAPATLTAVGYCIAAGVATPDPVWAEHCPAQIDAWLATQLGQGRAQHPSVTTSGSAAEAAWPKITIAPPSRRVQPLGVRKVAALWRPGNRTNERRGPKALATPAVGDLARVWDQWAERRGLALP